MAFHDLARLWRDTHTLLKSGEVGLYQLGLSHKFRNLNLKSWTCYLIKYFFRKDNENA